MLIPGSLVSMWPTDRPADRCVAHNTQLAVFGYVMALLAAGVPGYHIRKAYIEFENVDEPEDVVSNPTVDPMDTTHGTAYYTSLSGSSVRDFLRVDLLGGARFSPAPDFEGYFAAGQGNLLTLVAQTAGTVGFHGRTFSNGVNSKICGCALVVAPDEQDQTKDIVVARVYYDAADQKVKPSSGQISTSWSVPFLLPE